MGERARSYLMNYYTPEQCAYRYLQVMMDCFGRRRGAGTGVCE